MRAILMVVLGVGMLSVKSSASFNDCYTKCFIFCMIEPSQTLCSCTTHCLKDCIFPQTPDDIREDSDSDNLGFCKLGCAFSKCSTLSSKRTPSKSLLSPSLSLELYVVNDFDVYYDCVADGEKVDSCVGSCSNKCTKSYSSSP